MSFTGPSDKIFLLTDAGTKLDVPMIQKKTTKVFRESRNTKDDLQMTAAKIYM